MKWFSFIIILVCFSVFIFADETPIISIDKILEIISMAESSNNSYANVNNGWNDIPDSRGLYQITPILLKDYNAINSPQYTLDNLYNQDINEKIAIWFIEYRIIPALKKNDMKIDVAHIIFCYNCGINKLLQNNGKIPKWTIRHPNKVYRKIFIDYFKNK